MQSDEFDFRIDFRERFPAIFEWIPLPILCLIFAVGNLNIPLVVYRSRMEWFGILITFLLGVAASEIAIVASWFALRRTTLQVRTLICFPLLGLETVCFVGGVKFCDPKLPTQVINIIFCTAAFGFLSLCLPLVFFRWWTGWRLVSNFDLECNEKKSQFSIGFLLVTTAAFAVLYAAIKAIWPSNTQAMPPNYQIGISVFVFAIYSVFLFAPSFAIGLSSENRPLALFVLIIELIFIAPLTMLFLSTVFRGNWRPESVLFFYCFSVGFISSVAATALWFRFNGFCFEKATLTSEVPREISQPEM